jgi:hypothetical protein
MQIALQQYKLFLIFAYFCIDVLLVICYLFCPYEIMYCNSHQNYSIHTTNAITSLSHIKVSPFWPSFSGYPTIPCSLLATIHSPGLLQFFYLLCLLPLFCHFHLLPLLLLLCPCSFPLRQLLLLQPLPLALPPLPLWLSPSLPPCLAALYS